MSYRHRIYSLDRKTTEELHKCSSYKEYLEAVKEYASKNNLKIVCDEPQEGEARPYYPLYKLGKEIYNFGSRYNNANEMYKHGNSLFSSDELNEYFSEEHPIILDKSGLLCAIEYYRNCVIKEMEEVLSEAPPKCWDKRSHIDRLKTYVDDRLRDWTVYKEWGESHNIYNLNPESDNIVSSWYFEYQIFELVRIYKTFDWENNCMLFYGW